MAQMLDRRGFLYVTIGTLAGCGKPPEPPAATSVAVSTSGSLSAGDIEAFLAIVARLPGQMPPAFQPAPEIDFTVDSSAGEMVARWQREFRSSYSPSVQAKLWKRNPRLREALEECGVEPESFAQLLVRMSTAVVRSSLDPAIDLAPLAAQAERTVASLASQLDGLDSDPRLSPSVRNARAELLSSMLKEAVAYREFLRLLEGVPPESVTAVAGRSDELRRLMPPTETVQVFQKKLQSQSKVMQASHEAPAR